MSESVRLTAMAALCLFGLVSICFHIVGSAFQALDDQSHPLLNAEPPFSDDPLKYHTTGTSSLMIEDR